MAAALKAIASATTSTLVKELNLCTPLPAYIAQGGDAALRDALLMVYAFSFAGLNMGNYPPGQSTGLSRACGLFKTADEEARAAEEEATAEAEVTVEVMAEDEVAADAQAAAVAELVTTEDEAWAEDEAEDEVWAEDEVMAEADVWAALREFLAGGYSSTLRGTTPWGSSPEPWGSSSSPAAASHSSQCYDLAGQLPAGPNGTVTCADWSGCGAGANGRSWDYETCRYLVEPIGTSEPPQPPQTPRSLCSLGRCASFFAALPSSLRPRVYLSCLPP